MPINQEKLAKLAKSEQIRIGGKGSARRKKKVVHKTTTDDKKLQSNLKKLGVNNIPGIEEVNMMKEDGNVIHFTNPKVQASLHGNTFAISGSSEEKPMTEMLPNILSQIMGPGAEALPNLKNLVKAAKPAEGGEGEEEGDGDDDVPDLVENFEEVAKES